MPIILNKQLSNKEISILRFLFIVRGATNLQVVKGLGLELTVSNEKNMYAPLRRLVKENLLDCTFIKPEGRKYFFLSEEGFEFMKRVLDIKAHYIGSGYGEDFGDFSYNLQKPPTVQSAHYVLQVDSILEIEKVKKRELPIKGHFIIDWRDNRYISKNFEITKPDATKVTGEIKPDMELKISLYNEERVLSATYIYLIEVDTGSERKGRLLHKLSTYNLFFEYLKAENKPLPNGILFVGSSKEHQYGLDTRWSSITDVFQETLESYGNKVNLHYVTMDDLQYVIQREIMYKTATPKTLTDFSNHVTNNPNFVGNPMTFFTKKTLLYDGFMPVTTAKTASGQEFMYCYIRNDGYETMGWYELKRFLAFIDRERTINPQYKQVRKIVPVVYYYTKPGPLPAPDFFHHSPLLQLKDIIYYHGIKEQWFNQNMQRIVELPLPAKKQGSR